MKKMNISKKDPIINILIESMVNLPTPSSISYLWNMGFLLGMTLTLQIITGLVLSMNFIPHTDLAFNSVIHIMRDIDHGWIMRYIHMNGASLFFIFMYTHMARGLYFNSPQKLPMVWSSGVIILLLSMMTAFMGYVLPWGQMSFWGATVITSMISAIPYLGLYITTWVWGNFSVSQPTLNRFFSLHFLMPFIITVLVILHLIFLHETGSSNPTGLNTDYDKVKFFPLFLTKDTLPLIMVCFPLILILTMNPNMLGDVENFNPASPTTTPPHIQPEWYFLFAYAILRAIPSKLGGVAAMAGAILILLILATKKEKTNKKFNPYKKFMFWTFLSIFILLTWIGANPVEPPYITIGMFLSMIYFLLVIFFLFLNSLNEHNFFKVKEMSGILSIILMSSLFAISSQSWPMVWIFMEINSIAMSSLICKDMKKTNTTFYPSMMYLIIQLISSIVFLFSINMNFSLWMKNILCLSCFLMKMGAWPFHMWYMKMLQKMEMQQKSMMTIMTWQKIIPIFFIPLFKMKLIIMYISLFIMTTPIFFIKKNSSFKKVMIMSSINNSAWLILASMCSWLLMMMFFLIYSLSLFTSFLYLCMMKSKKSQKTTKTWENLVILGNLNSIPPSPMFLAKIMILYNLMKTMMPKEVLTFMMITGCFLSYNYFWTTLSTLTTPMVKNQNQKEIQSKKKFFLMSVSFLMLMTILILID